MTVKFSEPARDFAWASLIIAPIVAIAWMVHTNIGPVRGIHWLLLTATAICALTCGRAAGVWAALLTTASFCLILSPLNGAPPTIMSVFLAGGASLSIVAIIDAAKHQKTAQPTLRGAIGWLPFIRGTTKGRTFWAVQETGDYSADCAAGAHLAAELVADIRRQNRPELMGWAVGDMIEKGKITGVEVGFLAELGRSLAENNPDDAALKARVVKGQYNGHSGSVHE